MSQARIDVLVIEDDVWLGELFQRTIQNAGLTSFAVSNGHEAIDKIDDLHPSVIVLDVLLAGGTAMTLLHELQSYNDTAKIPIVLCTNLASQLSLKELEPYGVRRILDKTTMHPEDIVTAIRSVSP